MAICVCLLTVLIYLGVLAPMSTAALSRGCGRALAPETKTGGTGNSNTVKVHSNGVERSFLLHIPNSYEEDLAHGLIFSFHGRGRTASHQEELSGFSEDMINPSMVVAYPQGIGRVWQGDPDATTDDVKFTLDMIDKIAGDYCIDTNKIYASGKSNGGGFAANVLACNAKTSKRIAAFASVSGAYYQNNTKSGCDPEDVPIKCSPSRKPIPILEFHGTADKTIPYHGGPRRGKCLPSVEHFMSAWAQRNGFSKVNTTSRIHGGNVHKHEFGHPKDHQDWNTAYLVQGLGHTWPSTVPNVDSDSPTYFDASPLIVKFFDEHTLP